MGSSNSRKKGKTFMSIGDMEKGFPVGHDGLVIRVGIKAVRCHF